ncbi:MULTISPECIES: hypothetical protein [Halorussus]|uniref:hypothetical protein n=1 Tax=Halorussus TaxID=1070314 RepID=UPI00209F303D|nr:hypothetical protein [Halorussus vallis]USZ78722.1 hypothetical protein NGM07_24740 [Halorussus vallis]
MPSDGQASGKPSLAVAIVRELREHDDHCIRVGGYGDAYPFVRYHAETGEWRWADYERQRRVAGRILDESTVVEIVAAKHISLVAVENAVGGLTDDGPTVWEDADAQDVFSEFDRCFWCGGSERTHDLARYETTEDGECLLCSDCYESFDDSGQILGPSTTEAEA